MILARVPRRQIGFLPVPRHAHVAVESTLEGSKQLATLWLRGGEADAPAIAISRQVVRIGSDSVNDVVVPGRGVSPRHAELRLRQGLWYFRDLGSAGGSWVDDELVRDVMLLSPGSNVRLGETTLTFGPDDRWEDSGADVPDEAPPLLFVLPEPRRSVWPRVLLVAGLLAIAAAIYLAVRAG